MIVKDLEIGRLSCITWMGPKCKDKCHYKREAERELITEEEGNMTKHNARLLALKIEEGAESKGMQL